MRIASLQNHQHQVGLGQGFVRFLNANAFGFVRGRANSGGINQTYGNAGNGNGFAHQVARGSGRGGDDGALPLDQAVEETRFAYVRPAYDGQGQALMNNFAVRK